MRRVVVDMQNALFADAIATALQKFDSDFEVCQSDRPDKTADLCVFTEANILIMEVTAYTPWKLEERMNIRNEVKAQNPNCKIVLVERRELLIEEKRQSTCCGKRRNACNCTPSSSRNNQSLIADKELSFGSIFPRDNQSLERSSHQCKDRLFVGNEGECFGRTPYPCRNRIARIRQSNGFQQRPNRRTKRSDNTTCQKRQKTC